LSDKEDGTQKIVAGSLIIVVMNEAKDLEMNFKISRGKVSLKIQRTSAIDGSLSVSR
jgi:hypothetical protein